jgi:hypothetical protein
MPTLNILIAVQLSEEYPSQGACRISRAENTPRKPHPLSCDTPRLSYATPHSHSTLSNPPKIHVVHIYTVHFVECTFAYTMTQHIRKHMQSKQFKVVQTTELCHPLLSQSGHNSLPVLSHITDLPFHISGYSYDHAGYRVLVN